MSWKEKVSYREMILFCDVYRTKQEIKERFKLTPIQATHCINWFSKFDDDFLLEKERGTTNKAWYLKTRTKVLESYKYGNQK